jgi:hypothetical protein
MATINQPADGMAQRRAAFAQSNFPAEIHDYDFADFPACSLEHG